MREVERNKRWVFEDVTKAEVEAAVRDAGSKLAPLDHGVLPWPMAQMVKVAVAMSSHDVVDEAAGSYAKRSHLGPMHYQTDLRVEERGDGVHLTRSSVGMMAPMAELTNAGRAVHAELTKKRRRRRLV